MFVEEIIIDGFKSYATRTVISGWDPRLNAITGLNGSGKSNILDAICFVMGIDNIKQIRVDSLQDLIYKRGATGIHSATVTIIFNNEDLANSPVGFANCTKIAVTRQVIQIFHHSQVILGGKNKYLINGTSVSSDKVEILFRSAHLNINNPHFLIMQGQITKILNMKPQDISTMLEETAGTKIYQDHKEKAINTLSKKDSKVYEISAILENEIIPKLNVLREERSSSLEKQSMINELERLELNLLISSYHQKEIEKRILEAKDNELKSLIAKTEDKLTTLEEERESFSLSFETFSIKISSLEKDLKSKSEELTQHRTEVSSTSAKIEFLSDEISATEKSIKKLSKDIILNQKQIESLSAVDVTLQLQTLESQLDELKSDISNKEKELASLSSIFAGQKVSPKEALDANILELQNLIKLTENELSTLLCDLENLKSSVVARESRAKDDWTASISIFEQKIEDKRINIESLNFQLQKNETLLSSGIYSDRNGLLMQKNILEAQILAFEKEASSIKVNLASFLQFPNLNSIEPNTFHGSVASLIYITEKNRIWSNALEICVGGRLYNWVVQTEVEASKLLANASNTNQRMTILPLNRIQGKTLSPQVLQKIEQKVSKYPNCIAFPATSIIHARNIDQDFTQIINFLFGNIILTDSNELARDIAFDKSLKIKCITIDGDIYDPSGTMTGGTKENTPSGVATCVLSLFSSLHDLEDKIRPIKKELEGKITTSLQAISSTSSSISEIKLQILMEEEILSKMLSELERHPAYVNLQQLQRDSAELLKLEGKKNLLHSTYTGQKERLSRLIADKKLYSESLSNDTIVNLLRKTIFEMSNKRDALMKQLSSLQVQHNSNQHECKIAKEKIEIDEKGKADLQFQLIRFKAEVEILNESNSKLHVAISTTQKIIDQINKEILSLKKEKESIKAKLDQITKEISLNHALLKKSSNELEACNTKLQSVYTQQHELRIQNPDITIPSLEEKEAPDILHRKVTDHLDALKPQISRLRNDISKKSSHLHSGTTDSSIIQMIDSIEKQEEQLQMNLSRVKSDKKKIENALDKLNKFGEKALLETFSKVNKDFGEIMGILLPQSFAELVPNGENIATGVSIRVRLGSVWKNSLAFALILAMLQFSPAPIYILDEIDAALDLSHTQHLGSLLKTKFSGAQFIIVSLKEGLFNHSDVLFMTKFIDGISVVERHANPRKSKSKK